MFLVLARRARSIRDPDLLGNWLYGVAIRTARCARQQIVRRRQLEKGHVMKGPGSSEPADRPAIDREQAAALHGEVDRLPRAFRLAVVLCYFEGLTLDEAARRLRCPAGTVHSRLVRARDRLRRGLARRGIVLSTTAMAAALAPRSASASIPPLLCDSTTRAAIAFAARHAASGGALAAPAAAMAQEVLHTMFWHSFKLTALSLVLLATLITGAGFLSRSLDASAQSREGEPRGQAARTEPRPPDSPRPADSTRPAAGRMTVTGRVFGPDGKPAAGVPVDVIGTSRGSGDADAGQTAYVLLGRGAADADGRFRIEAARGSSARFHAIYALAGAAGPGTAFGCVKLEPDEERPTAEIRLPRDQIIRGRLVDIQGQPAAGVEVQLSWLYAKSPLTLAGGGHFDSPLIPHGSYAWPATPGGLRPWPKPVKTDVQGRFAFPGVARGLHVSLSVQDPRFAGQEIEALADARDADDAKGKEITQALHPAQVLEGRVLAADTGRPIPRAVIAVTTNFGTGSSIGVPMFPARFRADDQGRFRINPHAGDYFRMRAIPPEGEPYLPANSAFPWPKAAVEKEIDITLARGVLIHGKVTEQGTGRPVPGAAVQFVAKRRPGRSIGGDVRAGEDGSFRVAVPPGQGYLMIVGPTFDYVPEEIADGRLYEGGQPGGQRLYAHDIIAYEVKDGDAPHELNPTLKPGKTLRGRVLDPRGRTAQDAIVLIRQQFDPDRLTWPGPDTIHVYNGRFELPGFDPEKPMPAYFLDADHEWGIAVELSGRQADEDLVIRLQRCGRARLRFVGPDGKPVGGLNVVPFVELLMTPGATRIMIAGRGEQPAADEAFLSRVDFKHYPDGPSADADGRITLPDLIPGALYRIVDYSGRRNVEKGLDVRKDFTVKPGETLDLGDILVASPKDGRFP